MKKKSLNIRISEIIDAYITGTELDLNHRLKSWPFDFSYAEAHEVIFALLARQVTLSNELARSPSNWNGHTAPLFLRAMADVFINLAWVCQKPDERSKKFILHGLGQAKLEVEHRRENLTTQNLSSQEAEIIEATEDWINEQRATFLTDINLGSWSGLSTRKMAEESNCVDFYNFVYTPFSSCVHSTWNHIARYNLQKCKNPLHRFHSIPITSAHAADIHYLYLAARYLEKTFFRFDEMANIKSRQKSALRILSSKWMAIERELGSAKRDEKKRT